MSNTITVTVGSRSFELDKAKAEAAFEAKRVINGKDTMFFNILPLKYQWAYDLYKIMKANHWEPEDVQMQKDIEQWRGNGLAEVERWVVRMAIGYFSAAEGIVGDNILHVIREKVTAPELKLLLGRHAHEENIHADSLVYMISSLGINPHECEAMFEDIPSIKAKTEFVVANSRDMRSSDLPLDTLAGKQAFAKNIFLFGQVMEGTQFYGLFAMILGLYRQNKFPGVGQMFRYTLRDECLTEDHELLTPKGWVRIPDLALEIDEAPNLAQYHEDGTITFTPFVNPTVSEVDHTWQFSNEQGHIDLQVSDNHRMVMRTIVAESRKEDGGRASRCKIETAKDCRHNPYSAHICAGKLLNPDARMTELNDVQRLLIAYQADGRTPREACDGSRAGHVTLSFELKRPRKIKRLLELLVRLNLPHESIPSCNGKTMTTVRVSPEMAEHKRFASWIDFSHLSAGWCAEFIDELSYWDGHRVGGGDNRVTWGNTDKSDVDIVQTIAVLAGYRTHYKFIEDTRYEPSALYHRLQIVRNRDYFRGNKITKTRVEGKELVYGVTVPSGMLLVRRNNAIGVTGNSNHIKGLRNLFLDLVTENPEIVTAEFQEDLRATMAEGVRLEKDFIKDCLPLAALGLNQEDFMLYTDYIADRRLVSCGLAPLNESVSNPFPWLAEMMDIKKEQNFFEGRVTEYQKSSALGQIDDDDL